MIVFVSEEVNFVSDFCRFLKFKIWLEVDFFDEYECGCGVFIYVYIFILSILIGCIFVKYWYIYVFYFLSLNCCLIYRNFMGCLIRVIKVV